jgi:hypothetical protein
MSNVILAVGIEGVGLAEDLAPPLRGHSGWATEWQVLAEERNGCSGMSNGDSRLSFWGIANRGHRSKRRRQGRRARTAGTIVTGELPPVYSGDIRSLQDAANVLPSKTIRGRRP